MYNNLKILIRNLYRNGLYTWINTIGLAVSLAAAIFILLWVQDEWTYDKFYSRTNDIYKLYSHIVVNNQERYEEEFAIPLAKAIESELGEVEAATMIGDYYYITDIDYEGTKFFGRGSDFSYVDTNFFKVFDIPFVEGDTKKPFPDVSSVVLTDEFATAIFGNESALGKRLRGNNDKDYFVSAVVKKPPHNSVLKFKCLLSREDISDKMGFADVFVLLRSDANISNVAKKIKDLDTQQTYYRRTETDNSYILQSLDKLHLYAPDGSETGMKNVRLYLFVAIALLLIASINYVNLVTARAGKKVKEIGLRKIMGAHRFRLFIQTMSETIVMLFISFCIATILLYLLAPYYGVLTNKPLEFTVLNSTILLIYLLCFLFILVFAGIYPAFFISSFNPLAVFRVKLFSSKKGFSFRSILIVLQFACSVAFILATIVMGSQQKYMRTKNLGFDRENIIILTNDTPNRNKIYEAFKHELTQHPGIASVAGSLISIMEVDNFSPYKLNGVDAEQGQNISVLGVDKDFFDLIGI